MSEPSAGANATPAPSQRSPERDVNWTRRIVVAGVLLAVAVVLFIIGAGLIPRWWAQRIGDQVDGDTTRGVGFGLMYGFVFTLIPLIVLWIAFHKRRPIGTWLLMTALAAVLAAPNLLTLGIVLGNGDAAHAGQRILDTQANYFRASSVIGAVAAGLLMAFVAFRLVRRKRRKAAEHKAEQRTTPPPSNEPAADPPTTDG